MKNIVISKTTIFNLILLCIAFNLFAFTYLNFANRSVLGMTDYKQMKKMTLSQQSPYNDFFYIRAKQGRAYTLSKTKNLNTPVMNLLQKPLFTLGDSPYGDTLVWFLVNLFLALIGVALIWRAISDKGKFAFNYWTVALLFLMSWGALFVFLLGQNTFIVLIPLALAFLLGVMGYGLLAACLLGVVASLKLFFLLFLFFYIARKEWRNVTVFILVFLVVSGLGLIDYSWHVYQQYFLQLLDSQKSKTSFSISLNGSITSVLFKLNRYFHWEASFGLLRLISLLLSLMFFIYYFVSLVTLKKGEMQWQFGFSMTLVAAILLSPLGWIYYFPFLLIAVLLCCKQLATKKLGFMFYGLFCLMLLLPFLSLNTCPNSFVLALQALAMPASLLALFVLLQYVNRQPMMTCSSEQAALRMNKVILIVLIALVASLVLFYFQYGALYLFNPKALVLKLSSVQTKWISAASLLGR